MIAHFKLFCFVCVFQVTFCQLMESSFKAMILKLMRAHSQGSRTMSRKHKKKIQCCYQVTQSFSLFYFISQ